MKIRFLVLAALAVLLAGCSGPFVTDATPEIPSWDEFFSRDVKTFGDGYLVEDDIRMDTLDEVKAYYADITNPENRSTVYVVNGVKIIWNSTQKLNITYCISNAFGANKQKMIDGMKLAEQAWESAANINFIYVPSQDYNATNTNTNVVFNVRPATATEEAAGSAAASTFFPNYARSKREFIMWKSGFNIEAAYLFPHELGHTIGLRHEHIWFPTTNTESSANAQVINQKDSASIMYYYYLAGYTGNRRMSALDKDGVKRLYGAPAL